MTTLSEAYAAANAFWDAKGASSRMMALRATKAINLVGGPSRRLTSLSPLDGTRLLTLLQQEGLAKSTIQATYAAFRRMLTLSGVSTVTWPSSPQPPRRVREPFEAEHLERLGGWMRDHNFGSTANLIEVLAGTGMRVEVEALSFTAWEAHKGTLRVIGKGGHERVIPVGDRVGALLDNSHKMNAMRNLSYAGHLKRWHRGVKECGITTRLATPHAVRHLYATEAYERSGGNLNVVRELLGHADINTTARYIGVDQDAMRRAVGC